MVVWEDSGAMDWRKVARLLALSLLSNKDALGAQNIPFLIYLIPNIEFGYLEEKRRSACGTEAYF